MGINQLNSFSLSTENNSCDVFSLISALLVRDKRFLSQTPKKAKIPYRSGALKSKLASCKKSSMIKGDRGGMICDEFKLGSHFTRFLAGPMKEILIDFGDRVA